MLRSGHDDFDLPFAFTIFVNLRIEGNRPGHKINPTHNNADQEYFIKFLQEFGMIYCKRNFNAGSADDYVDHRFRGTT